MDRRRRIQGWLALALAASNAAAWSVASTGCRSSVAAHGLRDITAGWSPPVLSVTLPSPMRATDVAAAAELALRRMGYTIDERHATDDRSTVTALTPGGSRADRIVVKAEPDVRDVRVEIITRARPDEDRARTILDEMLVLLGL